MKIKKDNLLNFSAIITAVIASLCCIGPVIVAVLGIGSASLFFKLERFRIPLTILTLILIAYGYYEIYIKNPECIEGKVCASPEFIRKRRIIFNLVALLAVLLITFPYWITLF